MRYNVKQKTIFSRLNAEGVHYRFENVTFARPDIYSDTEWIQMARSLESSKIR